MANPTTGFGLQFSRRLDAAALSAQMITRRIAYNQSGNIFTGDLCQALPSGTIERWTAADSAATLAGVFRGCKYLNPSTGRMDWFAAWTAPTLPSTAIVEAYVEVDPNVVYIIRTEGSAAVGIADIGANFDVVMNAGNLLSGQSTMTLDMSTADPTVATLPLKMVGLYQGVPSSFNDPTLADNIVEVKLNNAQWFQTAGLNA